MIDIIKLMRGCKEAVSARDVSVEFNYSDECHHLVHITFKWCIGNEHREFSSIFTYHIMEDTMDITQIIIDDFVRHATGV